MAGAGLTGFLQNVSGGEMVVIVIVALVVLGPERLPELARGAGRMIHKFKSMTEGLQTEVRDVMDDPSMQPFKELGELAARPRQKLTEYALEAEAEERSRREADAHARHEAAIAEADAAEAEGAAVEGAAVEDEPIASDAMLTEDEPIAADATADGGGSRVGDAEPTAGERNAGDAGEPARRGGSSTVDGQGTT